VPLVEGRSVNKLSTVTIHSRRRAPNFGSVVCWRNASGNGTGEMSVIVGDLGRSLTS
jgi:hypothetical protein